MTRLLGFLMAMAICSSTLAEASKFQVEDEVIANISVNQSARIRGISSSGLILTSGSNQWLKEKYVRKLVRVPSIRINGTTFSVGDLVLVDYAGVRIAEIREINEDGMMSTSAFPFEAWIDSKDITKLRLVRETAIRTWQDRILRRPGVIFHMGDEVIVDYGSPSAAKIVAIADNGMVLTTAMNLWVDKKKLSKRFADK